MSELRPLRGGCQCGRNRYTIAVPRDGIKEAQVLFNTEPLHQIPLATPLAAYIRVPLKWYHSTTYALFPDETHPMIRRVYTHPSQQHSKRHFCGFCGTPLSYWSESPMSEAEYINLTLGSLLREDLRDLEDLGLIPDESELDTQSDTERQQQRQGQMAPSTASSRSTALRQSLGVPWFDGLLEGTRLGKLRTSRGFKHSPDDGLSVEWEIVEYSDGAADDMDLDTPSSAGSSSTKRKIQDSEY